MKFKDLLNEKFKASGMFNGKLIEIFENPTQNELKEIIKNSISYKFVRLGITDESNPTIYAWDGNIVHFKIEHSNTLENEKGNNIKIKFDFAFTYNPQNTTYQLEWDNVPNRDWTKLKNKKSMKKSIKKLFPKEEIIKGIYDISLDPEKIEY